LCHRTNPGKAFCVWRLEVDAVADAVRELLARTETAPEAAM
jgi:heptosyltransferase-3